MKSQSFFLSPLPLKKLETSFFNGSRLNMFFFVIFGNSATPEKCIPGDGICCPILHTRKDNDIVGRVWGNLVIKSSSMSQNNLPSPSYFDCYDCWTAPIETTRQPWIQYEYVNYKAKVDRYFLGDWDPLCASVGWALSGSNDNTTFYTIDAQNVGMKNQTISPFNISNNQYYYRYIRLTFTETSNCESVSLGLFTMEGNLKKWKIIICTPFVKKGIYMKHALTYVIVCLS